MTNWRNAAACLGHPPELWYAVGNGGRGADSSGINDEALAICATCPVLAECAADDATLSASETWGVRAQMTEDQRREDKRAAEKGQGRVRQQPHGTEARYRAHRRAGETACRPCLDAAALAHALLREKSYPVTGRIAPALGGRRAS